MIMNVRPARPDDRAAVGMMLAEFMDYLDAIEPMPPSPEARGALIEYLLDQGFGPDPVCATLIAEQDSEPVGYVSYHPGVWEIHRACYVISLFVRAVARGSGAGKALMQAVRELAAAQGARRVVWEVWNKNPSAIAFYESLGAEVYDENLRMSLKVE
ncbi:MAG TPA: GNAT family N-acetyltransferase [Candidatus Binatia bacterium]|nr:GNAT family N-acetyltransferase [Candidatus Binatia bacterium]